jgi:hypothetical protein
MRLVRQQILVQKRSHRLLKHPQACLLALIINQKAPVEILTNYLLLVHLEISQQNLKETEGFLKKICYVKKKIIKKLKSFK